MAFSFKRNRLRVYSPIQVLEDASYAFWLHDYKRARWLLGHVMDELVIEPLIDSEEYRDGERKSRASLDQQEQEESTVEEVNDDSGPERDDNGYLIR